jgi:hypothetical protein
MTYGSKQDGGATLTLTKEEHERFLKRQPVRKVSGYSEGMFTITVKITQPRSLERRFPEGMGFDPEKRQPKRLRTKRK